MNRIDFIHNFEAGTLPLELWDHRAHIRMALWYLENFNFEKAKRKISEGIRRYNYRNGIHQTLESGYHETWTFFFTHMIQVERLRLLGVNRAEREIVILERLKDYKELSREYYSREVLMTMQARKEWVEPDLKPLPPLAKTTSAR